MEAHSTGEMDSGLPNCVSKQFSADREKKIEEVKGRMAELRKEMQELMKQRWKLTDESGEKCVEEWGKFSTWFE